MKFRDKFYSFFSGRNGFDLCNKLILIIYCVMTFAAVFMPHIYATYACLAIALVMAVLFLFRSMSRNLPQRQRENEYVYRLRDKARLEARYFKNRWRDRKTHVYKKCPGCKTVLRAKRKKGKRVCRCPHCNTEVKF